MVGRTDKTVYPDSAASQTSFNLVGQAVKQTDPDGVTTLSLYNNLGELEYSAVDLDANGGIDFTGTDRITQTVRDAAASGQQTCVDLTATVVASCLAGTL